MTDLRDARVDVYGIEFLIEPTTPVIELPHAGVTAIVRLRPDTSTDKHPFTWTSAEASVHLPGGNVVVRRAQPYEVNLDIGQALTLECLAHPYLAFPAAVIHHWEGRHVLHGGAFDVGDRCIVVLADSNGGKSTTIAAALAEGWPARSDDVLILEGTKAIGGAPLIDLRSESGEALGGRNIGRVGARERWRITTDEATLPCEVGLFVRLEWGDEISVQHLGAAELLGAMHEFSALGESAMLEADPMRVLDLLDIPYARATRPRQHERLPEFVAELVNTLRESR